MRHRHDTRPDDLRQPGWSTWLATELGLTDYSDLVSRTALARCLLVAAALRLTVSAVARRAADIGREVARQGIAATLPADTRSLEQRLAQALRHAGPRSLRRRPLPIAIDIHRRPYYGNRHHTSGITGGKAQAGTAWFWSYATAVSVLPGHRHTLAVTTVEPSDTLTDVVERLLVQVMWSGINVRYVLLDRAFYATGVIRAFQKRGLRFIIPMVRRGKEGRKFFCRGKRGWFEHTLRSRNHEVEATVCVAVVPGPDGNRPQVFACSKGFGSAVGVALLYGRRFGIESSYRQLGECLAQTTSRDVVYRLLLVGVSVLIRAVWVEAEGVTLGLMRWDLILMFATTAHNHIHATQHAPPLQHAPN